MITIKKQDVVKCPECSSVCEDGIYAEFYCKKCHDYLEKIWFDEGVCDNSF